jgi:hypothetical protein
MVVVPADSPLTTPNALMLPVAGEELLHVPPVVPSLSDAVDDWQIAVAPLIAAGEAVTVTIAVTVQPVPSE